MPLTAVPGPSYTWASASWSWDDPRAGRTWATAYPVDYTEDDAEGLTAAEARASAAAVRGAESLALGETSARGAVAARAEALALADAIFLSAGYVKAMAESVAAAEALRQSMTRESPEGVALADARSGAIGRASSEALALVDAVVNSKIFNVAIDEALALADRLANLADRGDAEGFGLADARGFRFESQFADAIGLAETYVDFIAFVCSALETVVLGETGARLLDRGDAEGFAAADAHARDVTSDRGEAVALLDAVRNAADYLKAVAEAIAPAEVLSNRPVQSSPEAAGIADASARDVLVDSPEPLPVAETNSSGPAVVRAEGFSASDAHARDVGLVAPEAAAVGEAHARTIAASAAEQIGASDASRAFLDILNRVAEALPVVEALAGSSVQAIPEIVALAEARRSGVALDRAEAIAAADSASAGVVRRVVEAIGIEDAYEDAIAYLVALAEGIGLAEARLSRAEQAVAEAFGIADLAQRAAAFLRTEAEALAASEDRRSEVLATFGEMIAPQEDARPIAAFSRSFEEDQPLAESYVDLIGFIVSAIESMAVAEAREGAVGQGLPEPLPVVERAIKELRTPFAEGFGLADGYVDVIGFISAAAESLAIAEARRGTMSKRSSEALPVVDRLVRRINAIVAELAVREGGMTRQEFETFLANRKPLGHYPPKALLPGDYRYRRAILRLLLEDRARTTREIAVPDAKLYVDVPDVTDRGSVAVPLAGLNVAFTRSFYEAPEVQVIQTGGSTRALPSVSTISTTGFFVRLFDAASPTTPVAGTISWTALGK